MSNSESPNLTLIEKYGTWEDVYRNVPPIDLPWNSGGPDHYLIQLIDSEIIPPGRAIDVGTGPGHDAIFLAKKQFKVLAIDISPSAIELARENAKQAGVGVAIDYRIENILNLSSPPGTATFINDRVCFEVLGAHDRADYATKVGQVLIPGGHLFLRVFSENEPQGPGPHRFTRKEIEDVFSPQFKFLNFQEGILSGPRKAKIYICLLQKKSPAASQ